MPAPRYAGLGDLTAFARAEQTMLPLASAGSTARTISISLHQLRTIGVGHSSNDPTQRIEGHYLRAPIKHAA
jgi:hypothetical protein